MKILEIQNKLDENLGNLIKMKKYISPIDDELIY